jgi:4-deoxy-L-threo-5-hexosulose-uronate ketol-isomerase
MKMEVRYAHSPESVKRMTTEELRGSFLIENLFIPDTLQLIYSDTERAIVGSAIPLKTNLELLSSQKEMAAEYFLERREIGIINIGGEGYVIADGHQYKMQRKDMLYLGKGIKNVEFCSVDPESPAQFYFVSYPAHKEYPAKLVNIKDAEHAHLGSLSESNDRVINKYILPGKVESCQLVMGMTELKEGSVWNTMPVHTHQRRSEIYMYFDMDENSVVFHFMGAPNETRHIIMRNKQAVISPIWSIHSGCGTKNYSFVWAMGGENQIFSDMDGVDMKDIF